MLDFWDLMYYTYIIRGHGKQIFLLPDDKIATTDADQFTSLTEELKIKYDQIFEDPDFKYTKDMTLHIWKQFVSLGTINFGQNLS